MKSKVVTILLIMLFFVGLAFASIFVNKYSFKFNIEDNRSGESINFAQDENNKSDKNINNNLEQNENSGQMKENEINNKEKGEEPVNIIEMTSENFKEQVLISEKTVLIDFYADWCGPCKMMVPVVEKIASENQDLKVVKVNVDNETELAVNYGIMSIPTFVVIKNGEEVNRIVGAVDKSDLEAMIK